MNGAILYLDSSALIKLIFDEPETSALAHFLSRWPTRASSSVAGVEVMRTAQLVDDESVAREVRRIMAHVNLIRPHDAVLAAATRLEPTSLRALDAIHLATALSLGSELGGMVVYDRRLAAAARDAGLEVFAPA